jgi:outer membrane lipopolysaccharide assembly protein LptE/RlpB
VNRALLALAAAALAGCGYSTGQLVSPNYRTIAVPIFDNTTHRHDLEFELTRAVVEEIHSRTALRVVTEADSPDLVMKGKLVDASEEVLSTEEDQRIRESTYFLTAEIEVVDGHSGKKVVKSSRVTERESFVPKIGEDVRTAREEAGRALAERIVERLESAW